MLTVGCCVAEGVGEGEGGAIRFGEGLCEEIEVGKGSSNMVLEMFTGDKSGYLSTTEGLELTTYGMVPIPELPISVAFGYLIE